MKRSTKTLLALTAAAAQRDRRGAATTTHQFVHRVHDEPVARGADGVPERDTTAVDVHDVVRKPELGL